MNTRNEHSIDNELRLCLEAWASGELSEGQAESLRSALTLQPDGARLIALYAPLTERELRGLHPQQDSDRSRWRRPLGIFVPALLATVALVLVLWVNPFDEPRRIVLLRTPPVQIDARDVVRVVARREGSGVATWVYYPEDRPDLQRTLSSEDGEIEIRERAFGFVGQRYGRHTVVLVAGPVNCVRLFEEMSSSGFEKAGCARARIPVDVLPPPMVLAAAPISKEPLLGENLHSDSGTIAVEADGFFVLSARPGPPELAKRGTQGLDLTLERWEGEAWVSLESAQDRGLWKMHVPAIFEGIGGCVVKLRVRARGTNSNATATGEIALRHEPCGGPNR